MEVEDTYTHRLELNAKINKLDKSIDNYFIHSFLDFYTKEGVLGIRNKHLIGLSVSIHTDCKDGIKNHIENLNHLKVPVEFLKEIFCQCIIDGGALMYPKIRRAIIITEQVYGKICYEI